MHAYEIRKQSKFEEIDYLRLKTILGHYAQPRNKIRNLLKKRDLIRVKKGLYVYGPNIALGPYCKEHLANLIYGPSVISLEYALSFYGMIPERVVEVTSITTKKNNTFETPVGRFSYKYLSPVKYSIGVTQANFAGRNVLIATPEKALCDMLLLNADKITSIEDFEAYIYENLRLDETSILKLNLTSVNELMIYYKNQNVDFLCQHLKEIHDASGP